MSYFNKSSTTVHTRETDPKKPVGSGEHGCKIRLSPQSSTPKFTASDAFQLSEL